MNDQVCVNITHTLNKVLALQESIVHHSKNIQTRIAISAFNLIVTSTLNGERSDG